MKRTSKNATKPLDFTITPADIKAAKCKDPKACVIARAVERCLPEDTFFGIEVGSCVTKIVTEKTVVRYSTPVRISSALKEFDVTQQWNLPPGYYRLSPYRGAKPRWDTKGKGPAPGSKPQSVFKAKATATRRVMRIEKLVKG